MGSFYSSCIYVVYMGFVLYGLHNQSRLLNQYLASLDASSIQENEEIISMPTKFSTQARVKTQSHPKYVKFRQSTNMNNQSTMALSGSSVSEKRHVQTIQDEQTSAPISNFSTLDKIHQVRSHYYNKTTKSNGRVIRRSSQNATVVKTVRKGKKYPAKTTARKNKNTSFVPHFQRSIHNATSNQNVTSGQPFRKWAYAFLVGGCTEKKPEYKGFVYNVAVAAQRLRELGSTADVVAFIQMSVETEATELPEEETKLLESVGVRIAYLPKYAARVHEKFYALVQEKFRILQLTDYSRVLFLDSDIMPLCSMDYIFELSEPEFGEPTLKENVILSWRREPANAGFFMVRPDEDDFAQLQRIIRKKEEKALARPWPHWNPIEGWGHVIKAPDFWRTPDGVTGTNWTWHAVFADQGLLYYWGKYFKQSVSLIIKEDIENWGSAANGTAVLEKTYKKGILNEYTCIPPVRGKYLFGSAPYRDFKHFTGRAKPWQKNQSAVFDSMSAEGEAITPTEKWYRSLKIASEKAGVYLNFSFARESGNGNPPVGRFSDYGSMIDHIRAKARRRWNAYER